MTASAKRSANPETDTRDEIARKFAPVVRYITNKMKKRIPPSVQADDLVQAGMIGLLQAIDNFSAANGASFFTFATIRVRGAIMDELRRSDSSPRYWRKKAKAAERATVTLQHRMLRSVRQSEVAAAIGMNLCQYDRMRAAVQQVDDEDALEHCVDDLCRSPLQMLESEERAAEVAAAIDNLPTQARRVIRLLYEQDMDRGQVADEMGVSESRIGQIHIAAINSLRKTFDQPPLVPRKRNVRDR